jgi:amidase
MSELWKLTATEIAQKVASQELTARSVTEDTLQRLKDANPAINAVVQELPDEALKSADAVDTAIKAGGQAGALAGVPVTIKVVSDQRGHATTNGLVTQKDLVAEKDSPVVANLRRAGAIIVGRTNTPAFSLRWFTNNSLHGHTYNPRNRAVTPGGSSGGAAAATAAGIGAIGHATDIAGSIRYPAYACGIHGLRPTLGRVPAHNYTAADRLVAGQICAVSGPVARSIDDIHLSLQAMSAYNTEDPWYVPVPDQLPAFPHKAALCTHPEGLDTAPEIVTALQESAKALQQAGWVVEEVPLPPLREPATLNVTLWLEEQRRVNKAPLHAEDNAEANHVYAMLEQVVPKRPGGDDFLDLMQNRAKLIRQWQAFFTEYPLALCPVSGELPFDDQLDVQSEESFRRVYEAQLIQVGLPLMGLPGLSVATGEASNRPNGVQLLAGRYREDILIDAGRVIESTFGRVQVCP